MKTITTSKGEFEINTERKGIKLSEITEEQASEIVDWNEEHQFYYNYPRIDWQGDITAKQSLFSLLKSQGIEITENTYIFKV